MWGTYMETQSLGSSREKNHSHAISRWLCFVLDINSKSVPSGTEEKRADHSSLRHTIS